MPYKLDVEAMRRAAAELTGTHDFKAFCASGSEVKSTVRTLRRIEIGQAGSEICFDFYGNGFLYNMVRILVGTLVYVGQGRIRAGPSRGNPPEYRQTACRHYRAAIRIVYGQRTVCPTVYFHAAPLHMAQPQRRMPVCFRFPK